MSRRRSLRHLTAIAAGSGLITLAVAITGITPVWLAVGPLLLVTLDTLAHSPIVRSRAVALAAHLRGWLTLPAADSQAAYSMRGHSRLTWLLAIFVSLVVAAAAYLVSGTHPTVGITIASVLVAAVVAVLSFGIARARRASPDFLGDVIGSLTGSLRSSQRVPWLQSQLDAADSPLSVAVLVLADPASAAPYLEEVAPIAAKTGVQLGALSATEFLLVAAPANLHAALSLLGVGPLPDPSAQLRVGEATYPQDGTTTDELIAKARQRAERPAP